MSQPSAKEELRSQLDRTHTAHARRADSGLLPSIEFLEDWQKQRLVETYADMAATPRYKQAMDFFINDLYAPADVPKRDADLERMYPAMVRLLPDWAIATVAAALELQALSLELDLQTARFLTERLGTLETLDIETYAEAYRALDQETVRTHQIDLVLRVGSDLEEYVHHAMIYATLKMCRIPAYLAGLHSIQSFLEKGFDAFRSIDGAEHFLLTIDRRERRLLKALVNAEEDPLRKAQSVPIAGS
ncbi:MAG: hypothetical protein R3200_00895 [Xanthomonadales bacterium]|nr:hypothetical protein [Xanthomonadales bacterium]